MAKKTGDDNTIVPCSGQRVLRQVYKSGKANDQAHKRLARISLSTIGTNKVVDGLTFVPGTLTSQVRNNAKMFDALPTGKHQPRKRYKAHTCNGRY